MADIAAANVTVVVEDRQIVGRQRRHRVKITFGDGVLTYPALGVPLPAASAFGMVRNLDYLKIFDRDDAQGFDWKYDKENKKLRGWWPTGGGGTAPVAAGTNPVLRAGAVAVTSSAATAPIDPGQAKEFVGATTTIPATTIYAEAVGW